MIPKEKKSVLPGGVGGSGIFSAKHSMNPRKAAASDDDEDPLADLVSDKRLEKIERESYKHSFLTKLIDKFEDIESRQQQITSPKGSKTLSAA